MMWKSGTFLGRAVAGMALLALATGCGPSVKGLTQEQIATVSTRDVCLSIHYNGASGWPELVRRKAVSPANEADVEAGIARVGFNFCEVLAAWGREDASVVTHLAHGDRIKARWIIWDNNGFSHTWIIKFEDNVSVSFTQSN